MWSSQGSVLVVGYSYVIAILYKKLNIISWFKNYKDIF